MGRPSASDGRPLQPNVPLPPATSLPAALALPVPPAVEVLLAALCLVGSALFAFTRLSLVRSVPQRVLARLVAGRQRERLSRLLGDIDALATSAGTLRTACDLTFALLVLGLVAGDGPIDGGDVALAAAFGVPLLALAVEVVPHALVDTRGDALLRLFLPTFKLLQLPIAPFARALTHLRGSTSEFVGGQRDGDTTRRIVENLREVVTVSQLDRELDESEREIIENVMEFRDVEVASVMTPRTRIVAIDVATDVRTAIARVAEAGHGRLPVYRGTLDEIVGVFVARDVLELVANDTLDQATLASVVRPVWFVPETKRLSELLGEFRRQRIKVAIVVDEYGGTAGLVSFADVLEELVGEVADEVAGTEDDLDLRLLSDVSAEVQASMRVSEVNERLALDLPEDGDYDTIGGFVLFELGHFPKRGEQLRHGRVRVTVVEANERRVLALRLDWDETLELVTENTP
jgi:CBS domain containing-hemolysin-like protein